MIDYPIENCTKQRLWLDVNYKRRKLYIYPDMDPNEADKEMPIDPGETIILHFGDPELEGFHIEDKDGNHV